MPTIGRALRARRLLGASLALVLLGSLIPVASVSAAGVTLTPANASISADKGPAPGTDSFTTLSGPVITETAAADFTPGGDVVLTLAGSWAFDIGGTAPATAMTVAAGSACGVTATTPAVVTTTTVTTTLAGVVTAGADRCRLTFSGIRVKPTTTALPNVGTIKISYTPTAAINGLATNAIVGTLTEVAGAAAAVTFATQPSDSTGGVPFAPPVKINVKDQFTNPVPGATVTLAIKTGTGSPTGVLSCTSIPVTDASGDSTTVGCRINVASATRYRLTAMSGAISTDSSNTVPAPGGFLISTGPADHLVFSSYPAAINQTTLLPQPTVQVVDAGGNLVTGAVNSITLSLNKNDSAFNCASPTFKTKPASGGIAPFSGCIETVIDTAYTMMASTTGLTTNTVTGAFFDIVSGPPSKLAVCWGATLPCVTTPPTTITGGTVFSTQPVIRVVDTAGNTVVTDSTTVVSLGILAGTPSSGGPGTLSCTSLSGTVTNGVLALASCSIDKAGTGYRLNATSTGLTSGQTTTFNVAVGAPIKLAFLVQPPTSATAQAQFPSNTQVAIVDAGGNTVTAGITATISLAITSNPAAGTLTCTGGTTATTASGVATYTGCSINNQGSPYVLTASAISVAPVTSLASVNSIAFTVLAPAAAITISAPAVITWGDDMTLLVHFGLNGANKTFTIQVSKDTVNWSNIAGATLITNASGDASFIYGPSDNRYYRVAFGGTPDLQAGFSNIVRTVVRQTNQLRPSHSGYQDIAHGTQITFTSTVRPNRPELPQPAVNFVVYQLRGATWVKVLDRMVNTDRNASSPDYGRAVLLITFNTPAKFYVRSQAVPTALNANSGWSTPVLYNVK